MQSDKSLTSAFGNLPLFEEMYAKYKQNKSSVTPDWQSIFEEFEKEEAPLKASPERSVEIRTVKESAKTDERVVELINAYRMYGHLAAHINPLIADAPAEPSQLEIENFGFRRQELSQLFPTFGLIPVKQAPLLDIINALKHIYCGGVGIEYVGFRGPELEEWIQKRIEPNGFEGHLSIEEKQMTLQQLNKSELFESFLHTKYVGQKRFSLEGAETLIPMLEAVIQTGAELGVEEFVIGMAHRGRLNVLSNILNKSYAEVFNEFEEGYIPDAMEGSGDVKYHKGFIADTQSIHGHQVKISLAPNPSHLESVNPVIEGQVKAKQIKAGNRQEKIVPILIHGDGAIAGQGVIYETLQMYALKGYSTGGTIHLVINNQIGFTTLPQDARSTPYCTDIAKAFGAPVLHVNAENPEACVYASKLAMEIRQKFNCDVFVDLYCYRKYGHNEGDEPAFTQPIEYKLIRSKRPIREIYRDQLIRQGVLEKYMAESLEEEFKKALQQALKAGKVPAKPKSKDDIKTPNPLEQVKTGVSKSELVKIGEALCTFPEAFNPHGKLANLFKERLAMITEGKPIDWGMGELMAYATLLWEGTPIRLAGQDVGRGTFSHRHALWMDQLEERAYYPLSHLKQGQPRCDIINSLLSEFAALGFEYGYSLGSPESLVIWEAQFGDFSNGAQIVIDQYLASAEQKWGQKSSLTLLLPHGYEGQGPEHSSGRLERYLSLSANDNMQVVNPTSPAQLFHVLRRQALQAVKKPLIIFTPKGLLRHSECVSTVEDLENGSFQTVIPDARTFKKLRRIIFCSGRVYYDLKEACAKEKVDDIALIRIEQLYPLDLEKIEQILKSYKDYKDVLWVQEEPENMGAQSYVVPELRKIIPQIKSVSRPRSASPAAGSYALHKREFQAMLEKALEPEKKNEVFERAHDYRA